MFSITQEVLQQVVNIRNTTPDRLSQHEMSIAQRIAHCTMCNYLWIHHPGKIPERCPRCHKRNWDRPLLSALIAASPALHTPPLFTSNKQPRLTEHGLPAKGEGEVKP